jgi:chemotaxis protein MotB
VAKKRKRKEEKVEPSERWLITYADMITLLLGVFIILMSTRAPGEEAYTELAAAFSEHFSIVRGGGSKNPISGKIGSEVIPDRSALIVGTKEPPAPLSTVEQSFKMSFPFEVKEGRMKVQPTRDALIIRFQDTVLFDSGQANLRQEACATLDRVGMLLESIPNKVAIEGHTDAMPINTTQFPSNWELSLSRATSVVHYLHAHAQKSGLSDKDLVDYQKRMSVYGYSQFRPIDSDPFSSANRRIDIVIYHQKIKEKDFLSKKEEEG